MKLTDAEKQAVKEYGEKYLANNDIEGFVNQIYSHGIPMYRLGGAKINFNNIMKWLAACDVRVPSFFQPTFICDGRDDNMCPRLAQDIKFVGNKIMDYTFYKCENIYNVDIPDTIKDIGFAAFNQCVNLKSIELPTSLSSIGFDCFKGCQNLESVTMPTHVVYIGATAFSGCSKLKTLDNLESVRMLNDECFNGCTELDNIKLGNVNLGEECFVDCKNLKTLEIGSLENKISSELSLFDGCDSLTEIKTRDAKLKAYLNKYYPNIRVAK